MFFPFGDEVAVGVAVFEEPVVEGFGDGFFFVVEVVDVFGACEVRYVSLLSPEPAVMLRLKMRSEGTMASP